MLKIYDDAFEKCGKSIKCELKNSMIEQLMIGMMRRKLTPLTFHIVVVISNWAFVIGCFVERQ